MPRRGSASTPRSISSTLYDAFGQRQVSTIYNALNQYHVVMEVSPEYWENPGCPEGHLCQHVGRRDQRRAGDRRHRRRRHAAGGGRRSIPAQAVRNQRTNQIAVSGRGSASTGAAVSTAPETMIPLSAVTRYDFGTHAACGQPPGPVRRQHDLVQPGAGQDAERRRRLCERHHARDRHAGDHPRLLPGHGAGLPADSLNNQLLLVLAALARGLHRARHPLRELHPSDHDPVDPAVGRHRRAAGAQADGRRIQHHRHDRRACC